MWCIKRIKIISWTEKKSNEEVMEMAGYKRSLLKTIRKIQLGSTIFKHINRADGLEKQTLGGKILWYEKQRKTMHKIHQQPE